MKKYSMIVKSIGAATLGIAPVLLFAQALPQDDFKVAIAAREIGDHETAHLFAVKAADKAPWVAAYHSVAIYSASQIGKFSKTQCEENVLAEIDARDPEISEVFKACGFALKDQGSLSEAQRFYERATRAKPTDKEAIAALDSLENAAVEQRVKRDSRNIRMILADLKGNPVLTQEQAKWVQESRVSLEDKLLVLSTGKRHAQAVALVAKGQEQALRPYGLRALAQSQSALKDFTSAQTIYENLIQREDVDIEVISELFYVYTDSHQYKKATEHIENVRSRFTGNAKVQELANRLESKLLAWSSDADAAIKLVSEHASPEAAAMVVPQLQAGERPRTAIKGFENQLIQSPNNAYVKLDKARTHLQLRELDKAQKEIDETQVKPTGAAPRELIVKTKQALETARKPVIGTSVRLQKEQGDKGSKTITSNTYAYMNSESGLWEGTVDVGTVLEEIPQAESKRYETLSLAGNARFRYGEVTAGIATDSERSEVSPIVGATVENDYLKASLSLRTNNQATGARARAALISSNVATASLSLKPTSRLSLSLTGSFEKLSDKNQRQSLDLKTSYQVSSTVDSRLFVYAASYLTSNSSQNVVYYAPLKLKSNVVGIKASRDINFLEKRVTLGIDAYAGRQDESRFSDSLIAGATASLDFSHENGFGIGLYVGADQRVYDGQEVMDVKGGLNVSSRF